MINATKDDIRKEIFNIAKEETGLENFKSVGVLRGLWEVLTRVVHNIYIKFINPIYKQSNLLTATDSFLDQWGLLCGQTRHEAIKTSGTVTFISSASGSVDKGSWITITGTDYRYKVTADVDFNANETVSVPVEAEFAGSSYNIDSVTGEFTRIVPGAGSVSFGSSWYSTAGADAESDVAFRERIRDFWVSVGEDNSPRTYEYYAESVPGVREVKVIRAYAGYGTVKIIVAGVDGIPDQTLLDAVYQNMYNHGLICTTLAVEAPTALNTAITIEYKGSVLSTVIETAVQSYVKSLGIGARLEMRAIYDLLESFNLDQVEITAPSRDVQATSSQLIIPTVTATKLS